MIHALALALLLAPAPQAQPLFAFVHTSDSQPKNAADQAQFERVLDTIADSGQPGALLRRRVAFVLFAGDLVDTSNTGEWNDFVDTVDARLTASDIALLAVPGNHDQHTGGIGLYEQFIGDSSPWSASSAALTGQNGIAVTTGWRGLRFIGLNNSNGAYNQVSTADRLDVEQRVDQAVAQQENVFLIVHHPHNAEGRVPLLNALETPGVVGYLRGHSGSPVARRGLSGIDNPDLYECNTNAIYEDGALIYFEAFTSELRAYVLQLRTNPSGLPAPVVIPLVHDLTSSSPPEPPSDTRLLPVADAHVNSGRTGQNYGSEPELRLRDDGSVRWRSYLRFDLGALGDGEPVAARLRLRCTDSSNDGGTLYATAASWSESGLTWSNAPAASGAALAPSRAVSNGNWYEYDVSAAVAAGIGSFVLISASSNGAVYSSRQGANPPELLVDLAPPAPLAIASLEPATVEVLVPGTTPNLTVHGSGFQAGTVVELDGTALPAGAVTRVDNATLTVDLPPAALGAHVLGVRNGTATDTAPLTVVLPPAPRLQLGTGASGQSFANGATLPVVASGPLGSRQVVLMSTALVPSVSSVMNLAIGSNFDQLFLVAILDVPPAGYATTALHFDPAVPLLVHAQAVSLGTGLPLPSSNLQSIQLLP